MRIKIMYFLILLSIITTTLPAQVRYLPETLGPIEMSFTQDSVLFSEFLSEFSIRCQLHDTLYQFEWYNPLKDVDGIQLDSKYEKLLVGTPFFKMYPAFRIDCPNGYVLGIFNCYSNPQSFIEYTDLLSFDLKGKLHSRISLLCTYLMIFQNKSQQLFSRIEIINGEIRYGAGLRGFTNLHPTNSSKCDYRYKILDDATFKLLSVESQ